MDVKLFSRGGTNEEKKLAMIEPAITSRTRSKLSHTGHGCRYLNSRMTSSAAKRIFHAVRPTIAIASVE
jgi:hypothetical protein